MAEDKIIKKLLEHDQEFKTIHQEIGGMNERMDGMDSKMEGMNKRMEIGFKKVNDVLEELVTIVKKIQEDHTFAIEWLKRLQDQVEKQEQEITKIKQQLKIA